MQKNDTPINVSVTFRHTEPTEALKKYASEKISGIVRKYCARDSVEVEIRLSVEKRDHNVEVHVNYLGQDISAKSTTEDLYSAIDKVVDTLDTQLRKLKDKAVTQKHVPVAE